MGTQGGLRRGGNTFGGGAGINQGLGFAGGAAGGMGALGQTNAYALRAPEYSTTIAFQQTQPLTPVRVRTDVQAVIARTSSLPSRANIQTVADGDAVVLRGSVASEHERRLAEAIARLTPGVFNVRNELQVKETAPPPRPSP
jgi:osmotically-inducible protein OsmY